MDCSCNTHLIYFVIDDNRIDNMDYHFYRKNTDNSWTHKRGSGNVVDTDALALILDIKPIAC